MKDPKKIWGKAEAKMGSPLMLSRLPTGEVLLQFGTSPLTWVFGLSFNGEAFFESAAVLGIRAHLISSGYKHDSGIYLGTGILFDSLEDAVTVALHASGVEKRRPREVARLLILAKAFTVYKGGDV